MNFLIKLDWIWTKIQKLFGRLPPSTRGDQPLEPALSVTHIAVPQETRHNVIAGNASDSPLSAVPTRVIHKPPPTSSSSRESPDIHQPSPSRFHTPTHPPIPENETRAPSSWAHLLTSAVDSTPISSAVSDIIDIIEVLSRTIERTQSKVLRDRCVMALHYAEALTDYAKEHYPNLNQAGAILQETLNRVDERARRFNKMNVLVPLNFIRHQVDYNEAKILFDELAACLRLFSFEFEAGVDPDLLPSGHNLPSAPKNKSDAPQSSASQRELTLSEVTKEISPIPAIGQLVGSLKEVYRAVERSKINKDQWKLLRDRCVVVLRIAGVYIKSYRRDHYAKLDKVIALLQEISNRVDERARRYNEMSELLVFIRRRETSGEVQKLLADLNACLRLFNFEAETAQGQWDSDHSFPPVPRNETNTLSLLATQCALTLPEVTKEIAPIPTAGLLVDSLKEIYQAVEQSKINKEQWQLLRGRCVMVLRIVGAHVEIFGNNGSPNLEEAVTLLKEIFDRTVERARYYNEMNQSIALALYQSISDEIMRLFMDLDACLRLFDFSTEIAQEQRAEYQVVQKHETNKLHRLGEELEKMNVHFDVLRLNHGLNHGEVLKNTALMVGALQQVLNEKSLILQDQAAKMTASYIDAQQLISIILSVTTLHLPLKLLLGKLCIVEMLDPIKSGITCDIYRASFLEGEKVAKKVFRLGTSDKENVERYAKRFLENANLWYDIQSESNYILPFYGIGMEPLGEDGHFKLYMVSPLMKNFDAVTFLKEYRGNKGIKKVILRIVTDAALGLQELHHRSPPVVHSGMRGDNILVTESEGGILGGFGLTKASEESSTYDAPNTVAANKTDSQRWMAPEFFASNLRLLPAADVWGWAMATLEIVSGALPYHKHKQASTVSYIINEGPPKRKDHIKFQYYAYRPDEMWELLEQCWARAPEDRPTIDSVVERLEEISRMPEYILQHLQTSALAVRTLRST